MRNDEVVIIDEFTGRMMPGRRYSEGLHQALEAKEQQPIQPENQTLASITFQNYFRMYDKLAGMTGTALTEADEFIDIYNLEVVEIPTNMPMVRDRRGRRGLSHRRPRNTSAIIDADRGLQEARPAGAGRHHLDREIRAARRDAASGRLGAARLLRSRTRSPRSTPATRAPPSTKVFAILNARYHEQEAYIVAQAGVPGAITIATNMAGRGTDIQLGGNADMRIQQELDDVDDEAASATQRSQRQSAARSTRLKEKALAAGGLYVLGTERHESRRIDNQLRGRSGRQGDPGRSKFFLSLEDDLMRIFGSERSTACCRSSASRKARRSSIPGSTRRWKRRSRRSRRATSTSARTC